MILDLFAPFTAEDMWQRLGYEPTVALVPWRKADPALLVEESVTAIVQVDGKVRDRLEVSPKIPGDELEALARASEAVSRSVGEREIVNVIVRAPRLVNIATRGRSAATRPRQCLRRRVRRPVRRPSPDPVIAALSVRVCPRPPLPIRWVRSTPAPGVRRRGFVSPSGRPWHCSSVPSRSPQSCHSPQREAARKA